MRQEYWEADYTVALVGNPNVGKSTLFNRLTGLHQHTGNWTGKTVAQAEGFYQYKGHSYRLVDLPGLYSLRSRTADEAVAADYLRQEQPDCVLVICDATCLERNLLLVQQLLGLTERLVVALNLLDEAEKSGMSFHLRQLQMQLGAPVAGITANRGTGIAALQELVRQVCQGYLRAPGQKNAPVESARVCAHRAGQIARSCTVQTKAKRRGERLDRFLMRRGVGVCFLLCVLLALLWLTVAGANYPSAVLQSMFDWLGGVLAKALAGLPPFLFHFLTDGLYATVARVVAVMLPPMAIFFPLFTLLEDAGLLPRVAFLLDRPLAKCGGEGKMALPMCMGLGCNAAGVTGCRIIRDGRVRTIAMITNAMIPCNGRFPALILLSGLLLSAFGIETAFARAGVLLAALGIAVLLTLVVCRCLTATAYAGQNRLFVLELPPYRKPQVGQVLLRAALDRTLLVLLRAVRIAAPTGCLIWLLANGTSTNILQIIAEFFDTPGRLLGMNGALLLAFLLGLPANELVLPICILILCGGSLDTALPETEMAAVLTQFGFTWKNALCTIVFFLFHWPCGTTIATIWRETRRWKVVAAAIFVPTCVGVLLCFLLQCTLRLV